MTIQEYIKNNLPFYHITPVSNLDSILENGLKKGVVGAICTVRSNEDAIWADIVDTQLPEEGPFAVIKLTPLKHGIASSDVAQDSVDEPTVDLHNYIYKDKIEIEEDDIIKKDLKRGQAGKDISKYIYHLDNYERSPIPTRID